MLERAGEIRVKETTMRRKHERFAVDGCRESEIIAEKIDAMDMDQVVWLEVRQNLRGKRIAFRPEVADTPYRDAINDIPFRKSIAQVAKFAIERQYVGLDAGAPLLDAQVMDDSLKATDRRMKLTDNMQNAHFGSPFPIDRRD
jgi:hypothetical protein